MTCSLTATEGGIAFSRERQLSGKRMQVHWMGAALAWFLITLCSSGLSQESQPARDRKQAETAPIAAPVEAPEQEAIRQSLERGKDFLLSVQNADGSPTPKS